jgi:hypothetical protein
MWGGSRLSDFWKAFLAGVWDASDRVVKYLHWSEKKWEAVGTIWAESRHKDGRIILSPRNDDPRNQIPPEWCVRAVRRAFLFYQTKAGQQAFSAFRDSLCTLDWSQLEQRLGVRGAPSPWENKERVLKLWEEACQDIKQLQFGMQHFALHNHHW